MRAVLLLTLAVLLLPAACASARDRARGRDVRQEREAEREADERSTDACRLPHADAAASLDRNNAAPRVLDGDWRTPTVRRPLRSEAIAMQMPKPSAFHKKLAALVGDWTSEETMHPMPWDPKGGPAKGRYKVRATFDGFGIVQEYEQKRGGKTSYVGHGVMGYDTAQNCYLWHWSDSVGGVPNQVTRGTWNGNTLEFTASCDHGHSRYTYLFKKPGVVEFAIETSQDGQQWTPFMNSRCTRKAAAKKK